MAYNAPKPGAAKVYAKDVVTDPSFRFVSDAEKAGWNSKVTTISAANVTTDSSRLFVTSAEKSSWNSKSLAAINAINVITNSERHFVSDTDVAKWVRPLASAIVTDSTRMFVTSAEKFYWNSKSTTVTSLPAKSIVTDTARMFVSASEKLWWNSKPTAANILVDSSRMFVSAAEKALWNSRPATNIAANIVTDTAHLFVAASQIKRWEKVTTFVSGLNTELIRTNDSTITINTGFKKLTTAERDAWTAAPEGTIIINKDSQKLNVKIGTTWQKLWSD